MVTGSSYQKYCTETLDTHSLSMDFKLLWFAGMKRQKKGRCYKESIDLRANLAMIEIISFSFQHD